MVTTTPPPPGASPDAATQTASPRESPATVDDVTRFARAVAHDFSSPLLAIRCFAQVLIENLHGSIGAEKLGYLGEIVDSAERMQALNDGLVTWVRERNAPLDFTDVALDAVVADCIGDLTDRIADQGAVITTSGLAVVRADAAALSLMLGELLDNALRYADPGRRPVIDIHASRSGDILTTVITDNGIGVQDANRERAFGLFTRIEPGRDPGRAGVGLTLARTIVERHGGRVWMEAGPEHGTKVIFTLRMNGALAISPRPTESDIQPHHAGGSTSVRQSQATLAAIVESSDDAIFSRDLSGRIVTWNHAAETLYGYSQHEAIGQQAMMLSPADRMHELHTFKAGKRVHMETVLLRQGGGRIDVSLTISPIQDAAGHLVGASVIARDATERHQTEEQLRAFLEVAPDAIVVIEHTGIINAVNSQAEATFGYDADEMIGQPLEMLMPERYRDQHVADRRAFTALPKLRPMGTGLDFHGLRRDGTEFPADIQLSTIPTKSGVLPVAAIRDITERRRLEHLRDDFIGNASHELRTPLTTLAGLAETLAKSYDVMDRDDIEAAFAAMARQGERARVLIANLLDLSNIEGGRADFTVSDVEVASLVDRVLESTPPPGGKTVSSSVPRGLSVRFDPGRLEQVVTNLLVNAYRYGGTAIVIDARPDATEVILSVTDDGPGVAPDFVPELFEPFTRGKQANVVRGSGIGLALCRRVVRSMDGDIWYEADAHHHGSSFRISLRRSS
jgi:PAS domain S-box-containing protein